MSDPTSMIEPTTTSPAEVSAPSQATTSPAPSPVTAAPDTPVVALNAEAPTAASASAPETPAEEAVGSREERLLEALRQVVDPELMINIVDLGLIYSIEQSGNKVSVEMTLTSPACPAGPQIIQQSKMSLERLHDVDEVEIRLVMSPPWTPERMTDEARDQLGIF